MLKENLVQDNPNLRIYYAGYAHYFNLDDDWCNEESFAVVRPIVEGGSKPLLSHALRSDMNDLTESLNNVIKSVTAQFAKQNVSYVSISEGFDGHRFCEKDSFHFREYWSSDV